jgi:protein-tyrosine phosphatase
VAPWLVVGPVLEPSGYASLAEEGVTHVLDLRSEASDDPAVMRELELEWRRVPVTDRAAPTNEQLAEINNWLNASDEQPVVYVHCEGGLGRSPTIATALLMQRGFTRAEAHRFVLAARSVASPTPDQDEWLSTMEADLGSTREGRP